ncbi:MAG: hypothetical protein ACI39W_09435 [Brotaphodocola sp.]
MDIDSATLYRWKKRYCEICESLKRGKEIVDIADLFRCMIGT